jgi:hypothetical protein
MGSQWNKPEARKANPVAILILSVCYASPGAGEQIKVVAIDHLLASSKTYVGSPSIAILSDNEYIASHDIFGPASDMNRTQIFASTDRGQTWQLRSEIVGQFWSSLFTHRGSLYIMGPGREFGPVVIRRSNDGGFTWTSPTDSRNGLLLNGRYHTAPTPVVQMGGRLWRAMEDIGGPGDWPTRFRCFVLSIPEDADLLRADLWTQTTMLSGNAGWLNGAFHGWLEGNAVAAKDGRIFDLLRVDAKPVGDKAALVSIDSNGKTLSFEPGRDFVQMPGGSVKFTVRRDPVDGDYWALTNVLDTPAPNPGIVRNTLALVHSSDLIHWDVRATIWHHPDVKQHGWQYVDWQFDGNDMVAVARVADDDSAGGAHDFHDANYLTFFRIAGFRNLHANAQ